MPHYEFFCRSCKKTFSRMLALVDWGEEEITCPHCGGHEVEQVWSAFSLFTSQKCA
jgi:putative FmdB family regulatory protein